MKAKKCKECGRPAKKTDFACGAFNCPLIAIRQKMYAKKPTVVKLVRVGTGSITECESCGGNHGKVNVFLRGAKYIVICPKTKKAMTFTTLS